MSACNLGIKHTVEDFTKDKSYLKFDGSNFIQILTSFSKKVFPGNYFSVAETIAETLNKSINSDINIGKVFYNGTKDNKRGVVIEPTTKQLTLLNTKDDAEREEAIKQWESEEHQRELEERLKEIEGEEQFFQVAELPSSEASKETLNKVKEAANKMGIDIQSLTEYAKSTGLDTKSINGVADLVKGVIAIAHGMENVTLTEEFVHIATAILEQTNPKLVTELISKIDRFKIYKETLNSYKDNRNYQLSNGKPDIRKIKKEAVDKLITEVIINNSENTTQFPELLQETNKILVQQWWNTIKDFIRGVYRKTNIDIFGQAGKQVIAGNVGAKYGITQNNSSYYRGQIEKPIIDENGNLVLYAKEDNLYKKAGLLSKGISMTDNLQSAIEYGNGQLEVAQNLASETYDAESELQRLSDNGYWLVQIPKNLSNKIIREAGEVKIIGDKIIIPKGQYRIEQINGDEVLSFKGTETFYQLKNDKVDAIYNKIVDIDSRMELHPETINDKRHYTIDGEKIAKSVTEKAKENQKMPERGAEDKVFDEQKREWGSEGHRLLEIFITTNLIDKDGYALKIPLNTKIDTVLSEKQQEAIQNFAKELIYSFKEGTRFLVERKVVNEQVKGKLASTVDFIAIEPQENGEPKVDILDWKFTDINKNKTEDIPWFKEREWKMQMGEYTKILYQYGLKASQLRKARMIPFIMNYGSSIKGNNKSPLVPTSIEIGKINSVTETNMYLLPVPVNTESTGNIQIDILLEALRTQWEKLYKKPVSPEERGAKDIQLNQMRKAIRSLQLQLNFEPLINVGRTFLNNAAQTFKSFENIDYSKLSKEDIQKKLGDLLEYKKSAEKYATLDEVYLSHISREELGPEDKKTLVILEQISASTGRMFARIEKLQKEFVIQLALREELTTEENKMSVLDAEKAIDGFSKTFLEASKLSAKIIKLATHLILNAQSLINRKVANKINKFEKILLPLDEEAKNKGVKAFNLIGTVSEKGLKLIRKVSKEFWEEIATAKKDRNKEFFLKNMDVEQYNVLAQEAIERGIIALESTQFSTEEENDVEERNRRIERLKDSIDINRTTFNGYDGFHFSYIFNKSVNLEGHYSKEYTEMSENARKVWQFFTELNEKARQVGYLDRQGSSFFPLIEATIMEKFANTSDIAAQTKDFFQDFYKTRINEEQTYSKIDPETGQLRRTIPKYFTKTDKEIEQLSTDLTKVGALWVKSIYEYENARNLENTLLTLHSVEQSKGSLMVDQDRKIIMEAGVPKVNKVENKNADILQTIVEDYLYDLTEDVSSLGNVGIGAVTGKFSKDEEQQNKAAMSTKKVISNMDTLVRVLGVGLKPLIAIANYAGGQFQAFITAGNMYRFREFEKNNGKISTGVGLSTLEKALLHMIIPLNEDVSIEGQRKIAKKEGLLKFLGTWSFTDVMMITNSFPERRLQYANAMSFNENSMVVNGKIVNIRQYVKVQDRMSKYSLSLEERKQLEKTYEDRVAKLKEEQSLIKIAKIENDEVVIPNVSEEELAKYRVKVIEYNRQLNGQMSNENKAGYRRDTILRSFMMFKTWIPKLVASRALDIHKNIELDEWEYGRTRVFVKTWAQLGARNIFKMREILNGTEEGLRILDDMLEQKKHDYFLKTGQQLEITNEEFYDLIRNELSKEMKELGLLVGMMGVLIASKAAEPPEDATDYEKNQYKFLAKAINKISDEIQFYYNPLSFTQITQGNVLPALNVLVKVGQFMTALTRETTGYIIDDEDMIKKAYPIKYFLNIIPGAAQFNSEVLPYISPELAREMGVKLTTQSRR